MTQTKAAYEGRNKIKGTDTHLYFLSNPRLESIQQNILQHNKYDATCWGPTDGGNC
jgi:hypothetical protein